MSSHFNIIAVDDMPMPTKLKWHRFLAAVYDSFMAGAERGQLSSLRPWIAGEAAGNVLEIGIGTGANLPYYRVADKIVGIESDKYMLRKARLKLQKLGLANVTLKRHSVEELPFANDSFDSVVCTHVLCSVTDVPTSLAEIRRVLRPEGTFRFIEHVKTSGLRGQIQNLVTPLWRYIAGGCHMNRPTENLIVTAGFEILELKRFEGWFRLLPCIAGIAQRA